MKYDYQLIVIGAGSGGLVVASGAAGLGAKVALIEGDKMGGDCLNSGCVPSKTFLRSAHVADTINRCNELSLEAEVSQIDMVKIMNRVNVVINEIAPHDSKERYEKLGVDVIEGYGTFVDSHKVKVGDRTLTAKNIVISTGTEPSVPPIPGLKEAPYYTNKTIFQLKKMPKHLIVFGAGPIGLELGQGFAHLGAKVTLIDRSSDIFSKDDLEVGNLMLQRLQLDGMVIELEAGIKEVRNKGDEQSPQIEVDFEVDGKMKTISGDALLVALGRKPNTENLNLDKIGVKLTDKGHVVTDSYLRTTVSHIYACGDVTGPYAFTHMAGYQASVVVRNAIFPFRQKVSYRAVPWVTYTKPEVAHVGYTEPELQKKAIVYKTYLLPLNANDRAKAENDREGFLKLIIDKKGKVIGATMVGEKAGEQIGLANMAVVKKMKMSSFRSMIFPYPTELEIYKTAAMMELKEGFKPWQKKLVKILFLSESR